MALVSGQPLFSVAPSVSYNTELKGGGTGEDSDDEEYVYVSRLAEQIAQTMLDEEDDDSCACLAAAAVAPTQQHSEVSAFTSYTQEVKMEKRKQMQDSDYSVSHYAATWRDHGPTEWDCFYTPSLQQAVKQATSFHISRLDHHAHMFGVWSSLCYGDGKQASSFACETPSLRKAQPFSYDSALPKPKESIGTGVFLPKVVNTSSHNYRRKAGLSSKSAYAPRSKY